MKKLNWITFLLIFMASEVVYAQITFTEVSQQAGVRQVTPTFGAAWADVNNDGFEDLYSTNHHYIKEYLNIEIPPVLFINNGGTFTDRTSQYGLISWGDLHGAVWGDYNNDGFQDLFQSGGGGGGHAGSLGTSNKLYKNL